MSVNYFKNAKSWRPLLFVILLLAVIILLKFSGVADKLTDVREWINGLGFWAPVVFVLFYILAVILALPGSAITIAGATLFGSFWGVVLVSIASVIGASICFLISRYLARDLILRKLAQNEKFLKLDRMAEEHGAIFVAITRLVPIFPFNVLNYGFGLTGVRFRTYVFMSWLCMLPGTILYVVGTDTILRGVSEGKIPWLLVSVLLLAAIILAFLVSWARKKLSVKDNKDIEQK
ncbi:MAG: TVP38/TMEM64 family protein [Smithella sp.]